MTKKHSEAEEKHLTAWEMERKKREAAVPVDRRVVASEYRNVNSLTACGDELIRAMWDVNVPGSHAPDNFYLGAVQDWGNQGYDVSKAEQYLEVGLELLKAGKDVELRVLTAQLQHELVQAPKIENHPYHAFKHPGSWEKVKKAMPSAKKYKKLSGWDDDFAERIYQGWLGQLAGGSFGTAIEGYVGSQIENVYGEVRGYITAPETINDDVVYELILMDVYERMGKEITSEALGEEWIRQIPYGVSAEGVALRNLAMGIFPPYSGSFLNPYCDWIGSQMRGMICGMLAPGNPLEAARLAHIDSVVSHARNGVYGGMYAAVITSLAFVLSDMRQIVKAGVGFVPAKSEYRAVLDFIFEVVESTNKPAKAWKKLDERFMRYNWIHAYPNVAADIFALWYGGGDFTETMSLLAKAGYDVDCNGGLVGNVLGVAALVPAAWADPLGDLLETYIVGKEKLSIKEVAERTARLAKANA